MRCGILVLLACAATSAAEEGERRGPDPKSKLGQAVKATEEKLDALAKKFAEETAKERAALADSLLALLADAPADDDAAAALEYLLQENGADEKVETAVFKLLAGPQAKNPHLAGVVRLIADNPTEPAATALKKLADDSPHAAVRGPAYFLQGIRALDAIDEESADAKEIAAAFAKVESLLKKSSEFPDATVQLRNTEDGKPSKIGSAAKDLLAAIDVRKSLQVGQTVPEAKFKIAGKDVKLSEYRGSVVVLKYGAEWCGPCKAMKPHEKEMKDRLKGAPFVYLSVDVDENPEIAQLWSIATIPRIFVLDPKGVIRHRGVRGKELDSAVDELIKAADGK